MRPQIDPVAVGERIHARRKELGFSQAKLGALVTLAKSTDSSRKTRRGDVTPARISEWESGSTLPVALLGELCTALDVSPTWLLYGVYDTPQETNVDVTELKRLFRDEDLAHLSREKMMLLARLVDGTAATPEAARAALLLLYPPPKR